MIILQRHLSTHTSYKPYTCSVYLKAFNQNSSLTRHIKTHSGEKPYNCESCRKLFTQRGTLQVHEKTYTGAKPVKNVQSHLLDLEICILTKRQIQVLNKLCVLRHLLQPPISKDI